MKFYLINKTYKHDMLYVGQQTFDNFIWQQGLLQVIQSLIDHQQMLQKYKIVDSNNKQYTIEQFVLVLEKLNNKN